jgi:oligopeptide transport system ATP-binding protein
MRQRVMIAMAISSNPKIMIADEPTTALDVTIQAQILNLLRDLQKQSGMSIIMITHDLGVVAQLCSRIAVMCGGYVVEEGTAEDIFYRPTHPYTKALIASVPKSGKEIVQFAEKNISEDANEHPCPYYSRCQHASEQCDQNIDKMYQVSENHYVRCKQGGK